MEEHENEMDYCNAFGPDGPVFGMGGGAESSR